MGYYIGWTFIGSADSINCLPAELRYLRETAKPTLAVLLPTSVEQREVKRREDRSVIRRWHQDDLVCISIDQEPDFKSRDLAFDGAQLKVESQLGIGTQFNF